MLYYTRSYANTNSPGFSIQNSIIIIIIIIKELVIAHNTKCHNTKFSYLATFLLSYPDYGFLISSLNSTHTRAHKHTHTHTHTTHTHTHTQSHDSVYFLGAILRNVFKQAGPQVARFQFYNCSSVEDDTAQRFNISGNFKAFPHNAGRINVVLTFMWKT